MESLNYQLRKIIKNRGHFPNDTAAVKLLWLSAGPKARNGPRRLPGRHRGRTSPRRTSPRRAGPRCSTPARPGGGLLGPDDVGQPLVEPTSSMISTASRPVEVRSGRRSRSSRGVLGPVGERARPSSGRARAAAGSACQQGKHPLHRGGRRPTPPQVGSSRPASVAASTRRGTRPSHSAHSLDQRPA